MRTVFSIAAVALALSAGAGFAQQPSVTPPPPDNPAVAPESTPPAPQAGPSDEDRAQAGMRSGRGDRPTAPPRAARFYVQAGDVRINIKCADDEPTKVCADLLLQMLDRLERSSLSRGDREHDRDRDRDGDDYR
jgi:hypothetical protein